MLHWSFLLAARAEPPPTNFVVIDIDSMRADRLPSPDDSKLPGLARLVREGTRFTDAQSQSNWTLPALLSVLSGQYPEAVRAQGRVTMVLPGRSLPEILALYGYHTVGSWGETLPSHDRGVLAAFGEKLEPLPGDTGSPAVDWLAGRPEEPFFLYVHEIDLAHTPTQVPDAALHVGVDDPAHAPTAQLSELYPALLATLPKERALAHVTAHYDGALAWYDPEIVRLLGVLDERGLARRTVVVLTSEHGEELLEHGEVAHHGVHYDENLRVPLVVRDPVAGHRPDVTATVEGIDFAPSILERAGVAMDREMEGRSWLPLLGGAAAPPRTTFAWSSHECASVRDAHWKLALHPRVCPPTAANFPSCAELYDRVTDPGERTPVGDTNAAERDRLATDLLAWMKVREQKGEAVAEDPTLQAALQRGGYWGLVARPDDAASELPPVISPPKPEKPPSGPMAAPPEESPAERRARREREEDPAERSSP